jgi:uncharacterized protein
MASPLPLFPLQMVLFPDALLGLRVFEARYLDLMSECLRTQQPFGVVCLKAGAEAGRQAQAVQMEAVGVLAVLDEVDADEPGILRVRCHGGARFRMRGAPTQRENGLWVAQAEVLPPDTVRLPGPAMLQTVQALAEASRSCRKASVCLLPRPTGWTKRAGWPTAGASCCPSRWQPSKS